MKKARKAADKEAKRSRRKLKKGKRAVAVKCNVLFY